MFFAHCYDPNLQKEYKGIYTPNCKIDDEIYQGYGDRNIMDYLFDKEIIMTNQQGRSYLSKEQVKSLVRLSIINLVVESNKRKTIESNS